MLGINILHTRINWKKKKYDRYVKVKVKLREIEGPLLSKMKLTLMFLLFKHTRTVYRNTTGDFYAEINKITHIIN